MRLKINLQANNSAFLTSAYQYPLSAAIYKLLKFGSPEFSAFLHSKGYRLEGKTYKLFTFALRFKRINFVNKSPVPLIHILSRPELENINIKQAQDINQTNETYLNSLSEKEFTNKVTLYSE